MKKAPSKKKTKVSPFWKDYGLMWDKEPDTRGPDPRIRDFAFYVYSSDEKGSPITDPFAETDFSDSVKTMEKAVSIYHSRVQRPETQWCDLMMVVYIGGYFASMDEFAHPRYNESWTYLARWRADTVCVEIYSLNPMQFAERSGIKTNELPQNDKKHNGLIEYWKNN